MNFFKIANSLQQNNNESNASFYMNNEEILLATYIPERVDHPLREFQKQNAFFVISKKEEVSNQSLDFCIPESCQNEQDVKRLLQSQTTKRALSEEEIKMNYISIDSEHSKISLISTLNKETVLFIQLFYNRSLILQI